MERIPLWAVGLTLLATGLLTSSPRFHSTLVGAIGEALVVAGVLSLVVDPVLKARLVREASRGIFPHMLGFDQQPEIKERLSDLVLTTKLFRRNFDIRCSFVPVQGGVRVDVVYDYELVNPTHSTERFIQKLRLEHAQRPDVHSLALTVEGAKEDGTDGYSEPDKIEKDGALWIALGKAVEVRPSSTGLRYRFYARYSLTFPPEFYWHFNLGYPTINVNVWVDAPEDLIVTTATYPDTSDNRPQRARKEAPTTYQRLFMPGEHVDFRWSRSRESKSLTA